MEQSKRIRSFDGLRFFIILFLVFHHFDAFNDLNIPGWQEKTRYLYEGYLSVNFFFMLSGFCIAAGYKDRLSQRRISWTEFIYNRITHIYPTYLLCLFAAAYVYTGAILPNLKQRLFWLNLLMIQDWFPSTSFAFSYNALAWSISAEFLFYLLFCFVVRQSEKEQRGLTFCLWVIILLSVILIGLDLPDANWFYYLNPFFRFGDFLIGMHLYSLSKRVKECNKTLRFSTGAEICAVLFLILMVFSASHIGRSMLWRWQLHYTLPCAVLIFVFSLDSGIISRFLGGKVFAFLGRLAFPIYLTHQICLNVAKKVMMPELTSVSALFKAGILGLMISIAVSIAIELLYAEPLNRFLRSIYQKRKRDEVPGDKWSTMGKLIPAVAFAVIL